MRVAALATALFTVGCDRDEKPSAPKQAQSRMDDPEYNKQLNGFVKDQGRVAKELHGIERQMELQRKRARAALPEDATDEQILAELEANPVKYPEWPYLKARRSAVQKKMDARRDEARAAILARIAKEQQEQRTADSAAK